MKKKKKIDYYLVNNCLFFLVHNPSNYTFVAQDIVCIALCPCGCSYHWLGHNRYSGPLGLRFIFINCHVSLVWWGTPEGQPIHCCSMIVLHGIPKPEHVFMHLHNKGMWAPNKVRFISTDLLMNMRNNKPQSLVGTLLTLGSRSITHPAVVETSASTCNPAQ